MWFNLAASRYTERDWTAGEQMVGLRDLVEQQMTPAQIAEAERLASEWDEAHPR